jgi:RHS repeat-associated protein
VYPQGQVSGSTSYFYTRDHLGSIREMRSNGKKGATVARFDYDPYGRSTAVTSNTLPDFNFTGLYRHAASNLDFAVFRAYDPDLGRWLNRDPIAELGGINMYSYVANDALNLRDPVGEQANQKSLCDPEWVEMNGYTKEQIDKELARTRALEKAGGECYVDTSLMALGMMKGVAKGKPAIDQLFDKCRAAYNDAIKHFVKEFFNRLRQNQPPQSGQKCDCH